MKTTQKQKVMKALLKLEEILDSIPEEDTDWQEEQYIKELYDYSKKLQSIL